jgi:hypothetical protein
LKLSGGQRLLVPAIQFIALEANAHKWLIVVVANLACLLFTEYLHETLVNFNLKVCGGLNFLSIDAQ